MCLRPQYGLQPGHMAILRRAFLRPGAVEPQLEAHPRVAHVWLCDPKAPTGGDFSSTTAAAAASTADSSSATFNQCTCSLRLLLPATLEMDEVSGFFYEVHQRLPRRCLNA